jgi:hypothetical protein
MQNKITSLFYIKRTKPNNLGLVPIYFRITINGKRLEISTNKFVDSSRWSVEHGKMKGNSDETRLINSHLDTLKVKVFLVEKKLIATDKEINFENFKNELNGVKEKPNMLVQIFKDHNSKVEKMIGNGFAPGTFERYKTSLKHTINFMKWKYAVSDIDIKKIDHAFITEYEFYLRTQRSCNNNTTVKYIKNFKKIVLLCIANGWLDKNPFVAYKSKLDVVEKDFLTQDELENMYKKVMVTDRLNPLGVIKLFDF